MAWQQSYNIATESIKLPAYVAWNIISTYLLTYINEDKYHGHRLNINYIITSVSQVTI